MGLGGRRILRPSGTELWGALRPHACAWGFILAALRGGQGEFGFMDGVVVEESARAVLRGRMRRVLRRFGRMFFLLAAGVSLLLCVAAVGVWVASCWRGLEVTRVAGVSYRSLAIARGHARMLDGELVERGWRFVERPLYSWYWTDPPDDLGDGRSVAGFAFTRRRTPSRAWGALIVPLWSLVVLTAPLPLSAAVSIRRRRTKRRRLLVGHCPGCGYDCRATPGRCSECGRVFAGQNAGGRERQGKS
jgi:hypothetical protein